MQVSLQLHFVIAKAVELSAQIGDVGLEHGVDVGACGRLVLKKAPFCLQHLVLLLQETYLHWQDENRGFVSIKAQMKTILGSKHSFREQRPQTDAAKSFWNYGSAPAHKSETICQHIASSQRKPLFSLNNEKCTSFQFVTLYSLGNCDAYSSRKPGRVTRAVLILWNLLFGDWTIYVVNIQGLAGRDQICWSL